MTAALSAAYAHCDAQLRAEDQDAWLASLYAPAESRPHLQALAAFIMELQNVGERVRQAIAGEIRLQWWQDVVDGERATEAAAHLVAAALVDTMARFRLSPIPFGELLDAHRLALYEEPPADLATLQRRLVAIHGTRVRLAAAILGASGEPIERAADDAGVALGIAAAFDGASGRRGPISRSLLPADPPEGRDVGQVSVEPGRVQPGRAAAFEELRIVAEARLAALRAARPSIRPAAPAFLKTALVAPSLSLDAPGLPAWRRQWRLWRAARNGGVL